MLTGAKRDNLVAGRGFHLRNWGREGMDRVSVWVWGNHVRVGNISIMKRSMKIFSAVCVDMYASLKFSKESEQQVV